VPASKLALAIAEVVSAHRAAYIDVTRRRSSLLELAAMMLAVQHYEKNGYNASPANLHSGRFRPKWSSKGEPRDYSWWNLTRDGSGVEAHLNAPVWDGHGGQTATFVVDVGIVSQGVGTRKDPEKQDLRGFENTDLATFVESKSLPIYPMLVAQFLGIAGEITPWVHSGVSPPGFDHGRHFDPALVSRGMPSANTSRLLDSIATRGVRVRVIPSFDRYVEEGRLKSQPGSSVLARVHGAVWPDSELV
jgi:hypothetical protein